MEIFKIRCGAQAGQESQDPQQARFHTAMPACRQAGCPSAGAVAQPRGADVKRGDLETWLCSSRAIWQGQRNLAIPLLGIYSRATQSEMCGHLRSRI